MTKRCIFIALSSLTFVACQTKTEHGHDHGPAATEHAHSDPSDNHAGHQHADAKKPGVGASNTVNGTVEAACGLCIYKMPEAKKCVLAVKIGDKPYLVKGSTIHDHGNAHADDGICKTRRQAAVEGRIEAGQFVASSLQLKPLAK